MFFLLYVCLPAPRSPSAEHHCSPFPHQCWWRQPVWPGKELGLQRSLFRPGNVSNSLPHPTLFIQGAECLLHLLRLSGRSRRLLHGVACGWVRLGFGTCSVLCLHLSGREKLQGFSLKHSTNQRGRAGGICPTGPQQKLRSSSGLQLLQLPSGDVLLVLALCEPCPEGGFASSMNGTGWWCHLTWRHELSVSLSLCHGLWADFWQLGEAALWQKVSVRRMWCGPHLEWSLGRWLVSLGSVNLYYLCKISVSAWVPP